MTNVKTLRGPRGYRIELDPSQIIPDDPGAGTPALVIAPCGATATFFCAMETGELSGDYDYVNAPDVVISWLERVADTVDEWLEKHGG